MLMKIKGDWSGDFIPGTNLVDVNIDEANELIDIGKAEPICGSDRKMQIQYLCSAAMQLGVSLISDNADIKHIADEYNVKVHKPKKK